MKRTLALAFLALGFAIVAFTGCDTFTNRSATQPALIASATSPIADVPVPAGFTMVDSESTSKVVAATGLRFVDHRYRGPDGYLAVVRFYREELPNRGWKFIDQNQVKEEITLRFSKNNEEVVVTTWDGVRHGHIRIKIDPAARGK